MIYINSYINYACITTRLAGDVITQLSTFKQMSVRGAFREMRKMILGIVNNAKEINSVSPGTSV